ncbi:excisionase family DNA-binding protein [Micromonospora sp. NPDC049366]|uniref:excisionase family DNA-binding protein n=1 Tax=Micromonospora sp. NPDC049366 TaxID=3364271 RepID=UPI0037AA2F12
MVITASAMLCRPAMSDWKTGRRMADDSAPLTTGAAASALNVSSWTVIDYVKRNLLRATRTAGGHRRVSSQSVEDLRRVLAIRDDSERAKALEDLQRRNHAASS